MEMRFAPSAKLDPGLLTHAIVVLVVVGAATALRSLHDLDTATVATVFGAALGFSPRISRGVPAAEPER